MKRYNNTWINHEDEVFFRFTCHLEIPRNSVVEDVRDINVKLHNITYKYGLLMTLSPEYCELKGIDYFDHYYNFLDLNKKNLDIFSSKGYEFYGIEKTRVSKIFYNNKVGHLTSSFVHYILNNPSGNPKMLINDKSIESSLLQSEFYYESSPLSIMKPINIKENRLKDIFEISFGIESHCSIWLEQTSNFRYFDSNGKPCLLMNSDNKDIAYANTPRLNSFLRGIRKIAYDYNGYCALYDYTSLLDFNNCKRKDEAIQREGLLLEGQLIFQEDVD